MINCKRCDIPITFDEGRCLNASTGIPHDIRYCQTKPGYVYCPKCRNAFPRNSACNHYLSYGWRFNHQEEFVMNLIKEDYVKGDWFNRKRKRKTSFDKMKDPQKECNHCKKKLPRNATREESDLHETKCKLQTKLA